MVDSTLNDFDLEFIDKHKIDPIFYRCCKHFCLMHLIPKALFKTPEEVFKMLIQIYPHILQRCRSPRTLDDDLKEFHFYFVKFG